MTEYVEVTKVMEFTPDEELIEVGKRYEVVEECGGGVYIYAHEKAPKYFLYNDQFKEVKEEKQMQYTEKDLMLGTKLRCTNDKGYSHWTTGNVYSVKYGTHNNYVEDDKGTPIPLTNMVGRLNKELKHNAEFEIVEEETMQEFKLGDLVEITSNTSNARNEKDELYNVGEKAPKYFLYNDQFKEVKEDTR